MHDMNIQVDEICKNRIAIYVELPTHFSGKIILVCLIKRDNEQWIKATNCNI